MHVATVVVGSIIAVVGAILALTSGVVAGFDLLSLAGCGAGSTCLYGFGSTAVGGVVFVAGLGYVVRGLTQPSMPTGPPVAFPAGVQMMGFPAFPSRVSGTQTPAIAGTSPSGPVVYCSACGTQNVHEATFCHRCGRPIARPAEPEARVPH